MGILSRLITGWDFQVGQFESEKDYKGVVLFDETEDKIYIEGIEYCRNNDVAEDESIASINKQIDMIELVGEGLHEQLASVTEKIDALQKSIEDINATISEMKEQDTTHTAYINNNLASIDNITSELNKVSAIVVSHQQKLDTLEEGLLQNSIADEERDKKLLLD